jgi:hypothetical protein
MRGLHMNWIRLASACLITLAPTSAQQTFIVDSSQGPGTHFTDLPPAVAAARDGDTIVLRRGTYMPAVVQRGITILGEGRPTIAAPVFFPPIPFQVTGLAGYQTFVMKNVQVICNAPSDGPATAALFLTSCTGAVHLEAVAVTMNSPGVSFGGNPRYGADIGSCAAVTLGNCQFFGAPGIRITGSTVAMASCSIRGRDGADRFFNYIPNELGAEVDSSTLTLAATTVAAGSAAGQPPARPAIASAGSAITLGVQCVLTAGLGSGQASALFGAGGSLLLDPTAQLVPRGAAPVGGSIVVTTARVPTLTAAGAPPGGSVTTSLFSPANDLVLVLASRPMLPLLAPPFGELWLDPLGIFYVAAAYQGAVERWDHSFPIATNATRGLPIALQGASGTGLDLHLTTPCVVVLD